MFPVLSLNPNIIGKKKSEEKSIANLPQKFISEENKVLIAHVFENFLNFLVFYCEFQFFKIISGQWMNNFWSFVETFFEGLSNMLSKCSEDQFGEKCFDWKILISINFGFWMDNFQTCGKVFPAGMSELHSTCPEEQFGEIALYWKKRANFVILFGLCTK